MTQKDKVKELVGRGLNSYHTKSLQQIDRIEKKNKQQNHKISILSNELDNDYLSKTEEGSVVSLEHSKEGMVYIDSLEGNTMVNYCTDGSKELTLNGDIDLEGTFVTTTEGVDNGKVDVMCEGNTMVNLVKGYINGGVSNNNMIFSSTYRSYYTDMIKPNTIYTIITYKNGNRHLVCDSEYFSEDTNFELKLLTSQINDPNDYIVTKVTTSENAKYMYLYSTNNSSFGAKVMLLEGDWTNKEIPPYFEGMKSVGQDDENGHKIEILSQSSYPNLIKKSKNLSGNRTGSDTSNNNGVQYLREDNVEFARVSANKQDFSNFYWWLQTVEPRKKGETYTISYDYRCVSDWGGYWYPSGSYNGKFFPSTNGEWRRMKVTRTVTSGDAKGDMLFGVEIRGTETGDYIDIKNVKMEKGTNNSKWIPSVMDEEFLLAEYSNKKEILLNEPLRGLPNGVKDRFVKIGGKLFIERNCKLYNLNGDSAIQKNSGQPDVSTNHSTAYITVADKVNYVASTMGNDINMISDKIACVKKNGTSYTSNFITDTGNPSNGILICMSKDIIPINDDMTSTEHSQAYKEYFSSNPATIIYQLEAPIYEPLEMNPELITYLDTTHISNNSLIPCNMKIQNSGYNAIIKPSTLYTIALDTNKSGTIGMNLGGVKGTTTNNVLTLTTPATLSDDSLRLYGKGIKGSKVRLLEGDKTNWIPSHFEGMMSSFEDKFDATDNTYKMEILCNNKNLFDNSKNRLAQRGSVVLTYDENSKTYTVNNTGNSDGIHQGDWGASTFYDISGKPESRENLLFLKCKKGDKISIKAKGTFSQIHIMERNNYNSTTKSFTYNQQEVVHTISHECSTRLEIIFMHPILGTTFTVKDIQIGYLDKVFENYIENRHNKIQFSSIEPLRGVGDIKDRFMFKDGKLMIERNCDQVVFTSNTNDFDYSQTVQEGIAFGLVVGKSRKLGKAKRNNNFIYNIQYTKNDKFAWYSVGPWYNRKNKYYENQGNYVFVFDWGITKSQAIEKIVGSKFVFVLDEPIYEEIPFELQKIILEGYENGTLFFDTNIPPTSTVRYAGETPIVKSVKLNKTEVLNNTTDINDNIIPYLMDMDYRVVCLELATETQGISMARLFGGVYEMLKRDILSGRLSKEEYGHRLADYFNAGKLTEQQVKELEDLR